MNHTPTPWRVSVSTMFGTTQSDGSFGTVIGQSHHNDAIGYAEAEANSRRVVACVNACEGISTDELKAPGVTLRLTREQAEALATALDYDLNDLATTGLDESEDECYARVKEVRAILKGFGL